MIRKLFLPMLVAGTALVVAPSGWAGQAPAASSDPDLPPSHCVRVCAAEQFSNTVSATDPSDNKLLGVICLGDPEPGNLGPLYRGQLLAVGPMRRIVQASVKADRRYLVIVPGSLAEFGNPIQVQVEKPT